VADPWTVSVESLPFFGKIVFTPFLPPLEKTAFRKADFITAVTRGIYDLLKEEYNVPEEKLLYLPNGVDLKTFTPLPPDLSLKEELGLKEKVVLLYGGNLGYFQGWEVLLKTMTLLRDTPFHLLIVGGGSQGKEVKKRVMEEGMKNVTVLPPVPPSRMARLYSFSLLGLVTLRNDTGLNARPAKLFSIMACGKPVLYCGGGEGAKIVEEVGCGWVLPSDSPEKLASAIHWFYLHPEESSVMGERGRRYVEEFLSWEALVKNWLTNFKEKAHLRGFLSSS
jgi:glycosyltransferase involved in cell wall biosynthesis